MLVMRPETMKAFSTYMEDRFVQRLVDFLHEKQPESRETPEAALREQIVELIPRGKSYGLITERQLSFFVLTAWYMGPDFDLNYPAAREVLNDPAFIPDEKALWLADWTNGYLKALRGEG
jgi:hypothetical protein